MLCCVGPVHQTKAVCIELGHLRNADTTKNQENKCSLVRLFNIYCILIHARPFRPIYV